MGEPLFVRHVIFAVYCVLCVWACSSDVQRAPEVGAASDGVGSRASDTADAQGWATVPGPDAVPQPARDASTSSGSTPSGGDDGGGGSDAGVVNADDAFGTDTPSEELTDSVGVVDTSGSPGDASNADAQQGETVNTDQADSTVDPPLPVDDTTALSDVVTAADIGPELEETAQGEDAEQPDPLVEDVGPSGGDAGAADTEVEAEPGSEDEEDATEPGDDASETVSEPELCNPECGGKVCGDDGCGGSCGSCSGAMLCVDFGAACEPPQGEGEYRVGVDYHSTTDDFANSAFLSRYHQAGVREEVLGQLQGMADAGATIISTRVWLVTPLGESSSEAYRWHFPPTEQELTNLRQYTEDVAQIVSAMGHHLQLDVSMLYLWCADYREGSPETTLGQCGMDLTAYDAAMTASIQGVIDAVRGIYRPDGQHAVATFYLEGEVMTAVADDDPATQWEKANQRWFLQTYYPSFVTQVRAAGMVPSLYFLTGLKEDAALHNSYQDAYLPELSGHRSVHWIYRTLRFMDEVGLELPSRVDFSLYPNPPFAVSNDATVVNRVFDDLEATAGALYGGALRYGIAETIYYDDPVLRDRLGKAFAAERALRGDNPEFVTFWSTPYHNAQTPPSMAPFEVSAFMGEDLVLPFHGLNTSFEALDDVSGLPTGWTLTWQNGGGTGSSASVVVAADAPEGTQVLRLEAGTCPQCSGDYDGRWLRGDSVEVEPGQMAVVRVYAKSSAPAAGNAGSPGYEGGVVTLLGYKEGGEEVVLNQVGVPDSQGAFRRAVLVSRIPADVSAVALRFGLLNAWGHSLELDWVH